MDALLNPYFDPRASLSRPLDLSDKEIRVLDVEPGASLSDAVHASLRHISLSASSTSEYETVSYVWGDPQDTAVVYIDGVSMHVPRNAETALRYLRSQHRTLWIDCICINQVNLEEINHQVPFMGEVYAKSTGNLVWLGESETWTADAVHSISRLVTEASSETSGFEKMVVVLYTPQYRRRWAATGISVECDFVALQAFYANHWFRRLWVLQEVVRAPKNTCYCGEVSIQLLDIVRVAKWLRYKGYHLPLGIDKSVFKSAGIMWEHVDHQHGFFAHRKLDLRELCQLALHFDVSIAHDKIYAVLGLHPPAVPQQMYSTYFNVDYSRPLRQVLMDAIRATFEEGESLTLLRLIFHQAIDLENIKKGTPTTFPTWLPRLHQPTNNEEDPLPLPPHFVANARRLFQPQPGFQESQYLQIQGLSAGKIAEVAPIFRLADAEDTGRLDRYLTTCDTIAQNARTLTSETQTPATTEEEALAYTLIAGTTAGSNLAGHSDLESFLMWRNLIRQEASPPQPQQTQNSQPGTNHAKSEYDIAFRTASINRRFFRTTQGRIGLGPSAMTSDDIAVVACGSELPLILRPDGDVYWFVGAAYLHGVMFGELLSDIDTAELEMFDLG